MKLSIIIPYWNAEPYTSELLKGLEPQIVEGVEVILVDDGSKVPFKTSYDWVKVVRKNNGGCSTARNKGLEIASGDYIAFIDADDILADNYIAKVLEAIEHDPDIIEFSWRSLNKNGWNVNNKLNTQQDRLPNPSASTRVFKRAFIGEQRFNEKKDATEDEDFTRRLGILSKHSTAKFYIIPEYMYFYRDDIQGSKTRKYAAGLMKTKQVAYYYNHVTADMADLLDEIKRENEINKVYLLTNQNDIPELERYCEVVRPVHMWAHIVRGEPNQFLTVRKPPLKTQVVIYRRVFPEIGGLLTFTQNFIAYMAEDYDLTVVCDEIDKARLTELVKRVRVIVKPKELIVCDTLIIPSFFDKVPPMIKPDKVVRMCHACKTDKSWKIPNDYDHLVYVSDTARKSFEGVGEVIHNFIEPAKKETLLLMSATRFPAPDKGDIENRMRKLAEMLNNAAIPFIWLNFSDGALIKPPKNFYNMGTCHDMPSMIRKADYLVALSDSECWSYSVLEALTGGTALICTPFPSVFEMGVKDGVNAHIVPFNMDFDVNILRDVPKFEYVYDNQGIKESWVKILGNPKPFKPYSLDMEFKARAKRNYYDIELKRDVGKHEVLTLRAERFYSLYEKDLVELEG